MTTIVSDGNYVIADRRGTHRISVRRQINTKSESKLLNARVDEHLKLLTPQNFVYENDVIKCFASSGSAMYLNMVQRLARTNRRNIDLDHILASLHMLECGNLSLRATFLVLCERTGLSKFAIHPSNGHFNVSWQNLDTRDGKYHFIGSGSNVWEQFEPLLSRPVSMLDAFLFTAHLDPASVENYSVYSLKDNELYVEVIPSREDIQKAVETVQKSLNFHDPNRKPLGITDTKDSSLIRNGEKDKC